MSGSHVLKRDEIMCGTDGLSFTEVIAGLVPGPYVWETRPGIFCPSLRDSTGRWSHSCCEVTEQSVLTQHRAGRRCRHGAAQCMPTGLWWFRSVPDLPLSCLASQGSGERAPLLHSQGA